MLSRRALMGTAAATFAAAATLAAATKHDARDGAANIGDYRLLVVL